MLLRVGRLLLLVFVLAIYFLSSISSILFDSSSSSTVSPTLKQMSPLVSCCELLFSSPRRAPSLFLVVVDHPELVVGRFFGTGLYFFSSLLFFPDVVVFLQVDQYQARERMLSKPAGMKGAKHGEINQSLHCLVVVLPTLGTTEPERSLAALASYQIDNCTKRPK